MALANGDLSAADVAAVVDGGRGNGCWGNGDGSWWLLVLFLFAFSGGWNGNGGYNGAGGLSADMQRGFDQSATMSALGDITGAINAGFANNAVAQCNAQTNLLQAINTLGTNQQNCCCENRLGTADLKYTIATENCNDRQAVSDGVQAILTNQTAGIQAILDKMCQQELDSERRINDQLRTQLNLAQLAASQNAQTAQILSDNQAQTAALENYLNPPARPAYIVQNPNCCANMYGMGCNCGM